jgi:hypothetical protein
VFLPQTTPRTRAITPSHSIDLIAPCTDSFRWDDSLIAQARDAFQQPDHGSQRQYAYDHDIPRATLGFWLREEPDDDPDLEPEVKTFFRSSVGQRFLRRLVLALVVVFLLGGACGLRRLSDFLCRTRLNRFVASSTGSLQELSKTLEVDLSDFADEERPRLAEGMEHRHIALIPDENFHGGHVCLVAAEAASNFLFVEEYAPNRNSETWTTAIERSTGGLPVTVLLLSSDQAKAIIACAHNEVGAHHLPELFHGQRDLCRPFMGPLERQNQSAQKELRQAQALLERYLAEESRTQGRTNAGVLAWRRTQVEQGTQKVERCEKNQEQALQAVRGLGDDYHPFDSVTGAAVEQTEMAKRLEQRLETLQKVAQQARLGGKAQESLAKGKVWSQKLVAAIAWYWTVVRVCVEELGLSQEVEQVIYEKLLPGLYWQKHARLGRTAEERQQKAELAERLLKEAWAANGVLSGLTKEEQEDVKRVSKEMVGLFARSSSCVEGRNGRLALFHHGQTRLSAGRLKALTVIHNYLTERADGTTAAERFFGKKPRDVFDWLLERLPNLPRPAAKRNPKAPQPLALVG